MREFRRRRLVRRSPPPAVVLVSTVNPDGTVTHTWDAAEVDGFELHRAPAGPAGDFTTGDDTRIATLGPGQLTHTDSP